MPDLREFPQNKSSLTHTEMTDCPRREWVLMDTDVLVAGAGPIGLTTAIELRRRGISCRIIDPLDEPRQYAKAVGIQPRTLELFENMGVLRQALDASTLMRGQIMYTNGVEVGRVDLTLPEDVPYWFLCLPQYSTERILTERLTELGTTVERGVGLTAFEQSDDAVTCTLSDGSTVTAQYLVGSDGAHSVVRKGLGLSFEGGAFAESYMLGDVEVDWSIPSGYSVRANHTADDGTTDDLLVCIPLPGHKRYRMSMLVPDELMPDESSNKAAVQHGFSTGKTPELHHIQAVLDRLSPEPTTASMLRWSSVFRISHRIVDAYSRGRVFVAGDAAHIHPPTGAQGMNTGIQDAHNLAWKIALAVKGVAKADLLETYDAERRPVGEEVVGMTVRNAREGIGSGESSIDTAMRRQAQLLIDYSESPLNTGRNSSSPHVQPGERAPDARGMRRDGVQYPIRLFDLLSGVDHTLLLTSDGSAESINSLEKVADAAIRSAHGSLDVYAIVPPGTVTVDSLVPIIEDNASQLCAAYGVEGTAALVIRPDGYLGFRGHPENVSDYFTKVFAVNQE